MANTKQTNAARSISRRPSLFGSGLSRRSFLRGAGVALTLPLLESMRPAFAADVSAGAAAAPATPPRRMLAVCNNLGLVPEKFFPKQVGRGFELSPTLKPLAGHRDQFTVFSGVSHPDVDSGHPADVCFLTAAPHPGRGGFKNTISLDQYVAEQIGHLTRFPSINLGVNVAQGQRSLSWTGSGVMIPTEEKASEVFRRLFVQGSEAETAAQMRKLQLGRSILDAVSKQAKRLERDAGARDRDRLDQYFTSVRELEKRMQMSKEWENKPKPHVDAKEPVDPVSPRQYMDKTKLMYDMAKLAFETDSTRTITLMLDSVSTPALEFGEDDHHESIVTTDSYHGLSHHGKAEAKLKQLAAIDAWHMKLLAGLMDDLKASREGDKSLLDQTMIVYGSNLGNANTHVTTNLPIVFAGGGFRHGQHLAFDQDHNYPLPNLFVSMLQRMGLETDRFASSTGVMRGLDLA